MAALLEDYDLGVVSRSFEPRAMATALSGLSDRDIRRYKAAANIAARELSFEVAGRVLREEIDRLI